MAAAAPSRKPKTDNSLIDVSGWGFWPPPTPVGPRERAPGGVLNPSARARAAAAPGRREPAEAPSKQLSSMPASDYFFRPGRFRFWLLLASSSRVGTDFGSSSFANASRECFGALGGPILAPLRGLIPSKITMDLACRSVPVILRSEALLGPSGGALSGPIFVKTDSMGGSKIARARFALLFGPKKRAFTSDNRHLSGPKSGQNDQK